MSEKEAVPGSRASLETGHDDNAVEKPARKRIRVLPPERLETGGRTGLCSAADAAVFLVRIAAPISWLKIQDLLYYAQGWHLVWDGELLFSEPIVATRDGVRIQQLDDILTGRFDVKVSDLRKGRSDRLSESQKRTVVGVTSFYAGRSHYRLSEQIRQEQPWLHARAGCAEDSVQNIDPSVLFRFFSRL